MLHFNIFIVVCIVGDIGKYVFVCVFSLTRLALLLLVLHYTVEMIFHASRILYFSDNAEIANYGYVVSSHLVSFDFKLYTRVCLACTAFET